MYQSEKKSGFPWMFLLIAILSGLSLAGFITVRLIKSVQFDQACGGHIKRAGDANTVELAKQELQIVLQYLEEKNLTQGYTSIFWRTPDEDIGFWYTNLQASLQELNRVSTETSQLERTNLLIKLRETLLDSHKAGAKVTLPEGISIYPYNTIFLIWMVVSGIGLGIGILGVSVAIEMSKKSHR